MRDVKGCTQGRWNTGSPGRRNFKQRKQRRELGRSLGGELLFGPADQRAGWAARVVFKRDSRKGSSLMIFCFPG